MSKIAIAVGVSLVAGFAAAAYLFSDPGPGLAAVTDGDVAAYFDQSAATDERIRALEAAVAEERNARQLLEEELQNLYIEIERIGEQRQEREEQRVADARENRERIEEFRQLRGELSNEGRTSRLIDAGFTPERAAWILQRESELQMEAMQARFDARRSGQPVDLFDARLDPGAALRAELGDAQYEQYLQANNRPTTVGVGSVLESSPGQRAGLLAGDDIVSYGGVRVYDVSDLNQQTMVGEPGESVVVDIVRDGVPMQIVMPRGPIGVITSRFRGRR